MPTVSACINKIADSVSKLPLKLYKKINDKVEEMSTDQRLKLFNVDTNDTLNTVDFWRAVLEDYYCSKGAYVYINKQGTKYKSLNYVDSLNISINHNTDPIFKTYDILVNGQKFFDFQFIKIIRNTKNGYTGRPLQETNSKILNAVYGSLLLENFLVSGGGSKRGIFQAEKTIAKEAADEIKANYKSLYSNTIGSDRMLFLNSGIKFQETSATSTELQLNENKATNSIEVCKLFGFAHTILDGGASDEDKKQYIESVIAVLNTIEAALDKDLLLESEKEQGYYFAFDTKELTRGSQKERYEAYEIGLKNRFLQIDEVREEEDREPMGFNFVPLGLGDVLLDIKTKQVFTPNTGQTADLNTMTVKGGENN